MEVHKIRNQNQAEYCAYFEHKLCSIFWMCDANGNFSQQCRKRNWMQVGEWNACQHYHWEDVKHFHILTIGKLLAPNWPSISFSFVCGKSFDLADDVPFNISAQIVHPIQGIEVTEERSPSHSGSFLLSLFDIHPPPKVSFATFSE